MTGVPRTSGVLETSLYVADLDRSCGFYQRVFGFERFVHDGRMCALGVPGGQVLLSVPNFAHWYPRMRIALGLFGYDRRGILDETHLRFFTRATLRRLVRASGFDILEEQVTGLPLRAVSEADGQKLRIVSRSDRMLVGIRPTLFGYQYILKLTPHAQEAVHVEVI